MVEAHVVLADVRVQDLGLVQDMVSVYWLFASLPLGRSLCNTRVQNDRLESEWNQR